MDKFVSFLSGCGVVLALGSITGGVRAQGEKESIRVCKAEDGVLRLASIGTCPPGQESLELAPAKEEPDAGERPELTDEKTRADLDKRIAALEKSSDMVSTGNRVVAPFEVVDREGKRIFLVEEGAVRVYNGGGKMVATIRADAEGGVFAGLSGTTGLVSSLGASGAKAGVEVNENDVTRVSLGKQTEGTYSARFYGHGNVVAAIGQAGSGSGAAFVADAGGTPKALMTVSGEGHGHLGIQNGGGAAVAELTQGKTGGGLLTIGDAGGKRMVAAGVQPGGFGVVQTGPASFMTAAGLGLPGSYIAGKP